MSITIDYFFNYDQSLVQLVEDINGWLGCHLAPYQEETNDYFCRLLGMEFDLAENDFENDRELDFENYRYRLGIRVPIPDADFRPLQLPLMAFVVYALYRRMHLTGILVFDVQLLLARYSEQKRADTRTLALFDNISNEFVSYPKHINDIMKRMPENSQSIAWEEPMLKLLESEGKHIEIPGKE